MATDATGTPTTLGIPKFNTSADAPSGLGSNAQMDSIDTLIAARIEKPATPTTGDALVWNGTSWDKSSGSTKVAVAGLAPGSNGDVLSTVAGVTAWSAAAAGSTTYRKTTEKDVVSSAAETNLLNGEITIAAGVMGTDKLIRVTLLGDYLNNSGSARTLQMKIKFGGTTLWDDTMNSITASASRRPLMFQFDIANLGVNNVQFMGGVMGFGYAGSATVGLGAIDGMGNDASGTSSVIIPIATSGTVALDTSTSKLVEVTATHSISHASLSVRLKYAIVEVI